MKKSAAEARHSPAASAAEAPGQHARFGGTVFRAAFEASRAVMYLQDPQTGEILDANPAACGFYGYVREEFAGMHVDRLSVEPEERLQSVLEGLRRHPGEHIVSRHRLKDGALRDVEVDASPLTLPDGRPCIFCIVHDITARREAEAALRQREGLLRAILDSAGDGIGFKDVTGVYREANPAFCAMLGASCGDILGRRSEEFFDPVTNSRNLEADLAVLSTRTPLVYDIDYESPEGTRSLRVHKTPVADALGALLGVVFINHDVTQVKRAEAALRASEGLLRAMLQSAQDAIFVTGPDDVLREANQAFLSLAGKAREDLLGRGLEAAFAGEDLRIQLSTSALARETKSPVNFTQRISSGGKDLFISVVKSAVVDAAGNCLGVVSMGRDITAQKTAELALRESERRFSTLVRQAPVGVFETDAQGRLVFANERMQRQTGRGQDMLAGNDWVLCIHAADRQGFVRQWHEALKQKRELVQDFRIHGARGAVTWVSCRIRPIRDAASRVVGYLGTLGDITERKKAEAMRADVESVVRHDLKSPLGAVQNAVELLEMLGPLNADQTAVAAEVRALTRRMLTLIALSLDLHAMETGHFLPSPEPVDLAEVLESLRAELRPLVDAKGLTLSFGLEPGLAHPRVLGERRLLDAVFSNLLKNAAEASPEGGEICVRLRDAGDGQTAAAVRNLGVVPESVRERFFDKYATAGKAHGTGLGTYSARLMVHTMGGRLSLDTAEPGATTLSVLLPRAV